MDNNRRNLIFFLRSIGIAAFLAIFAVFIPFSWMQSIHDLLGIGQLPHLPMVAYLARSLSLFYAILGGIIMFVSFDITRYSPLIKLIGLILICIGVILPVVDYIEKMPFLWIMIEGLSNLIIGTLILILTKKIKAK